MGGTRRLSSVSFEVTVTEGVERSLRRRRNNRGIVSVGVRPETHWVKPSAEINPGPPLPMLLMSGSILEYKSPGLKERGFHFTTVTGKLTTFRRKSCLFDSTTTDNPKSKNVVSRILNLTIPIRLILEELPSLV